MTWFAVCWRKGCFSRGEWVEFPFLARFLLLWVAGPAANDVEAAQGRRSRLDSGVLAAYCCQYLQFAGRYGGNFYLNLYVHTGSEGMERLAGGPVLTGLMAQLTESLAMLPAASVSGLYFANPEAKVPPPAGMFSNVCVLRHSQEVRLTVSAVDGPCCCSVQHFPAL